jgi:hypothetical protein
MHTLFEWVKSFFHAEQSDFEKIVLYGDEGEKEWHENYASE